MMVLEIIVMKYKYNDYFSLYFTIIIRCFISKSKTILSMIILGLYRVLNYDSNTHPFPSERPWLKRQNTHYWIPSPCSAVIAGNIRSGASISPTTALVHIMNQNLVSIGMYILSRLRVQPEFTNPQLR